MSKDLLVLADEYAAATATFARALALKDEADSMSPIAREAGDKRAVLAEALAALDTAQQEPVNVMLVEALNACHIALWYIRETSGIWMSAEGIAEQALTAAKQAQPEPVNQVLLKALSAMLTHSGMDEDEWSKPTFDQARAAIMLATTKTQECGMCGYVGTKTDAVGQCPRCHWDELQAQTSQADAQDAARYRWLRSTTNWASNSSNERIDVRNSPELWDAAIDAAINAKERAAHGIKQGGQQ